MPKPAKSSPSSLPSDSDIIYWAGLLLAIGSFGVVVTSAFYALSPVPAALPIPNVAIPDALSGMLTGRNTMIAAGTAGIFGDVIMTAGALLLMVFRKPAGLQIERLGWALVVLSVTIFIFVDGLSASVLTQLAALDGGLPAFTGFKLFYNLLFTLGTAAFGAGVPCILASELQSQDSVLPKWASWVGIVAALAGLVSALLYFLGLSLPLVIGISIAITSLLFGVYGILIARAKR